MAQNRSEPEFPFELPEPTNDYLRQ